MGRAWHFRKKKAGSEKTPPVADLTPKYPTLVTSTPGLSTSVARLSICSRSSSDCFLSPSPSSPEIVSQPRSLSSSEPPDASVSWPSGGGDSLLLAPDGADGVSRAGELQDRAGHRPHGQLFGGWFGCGRLHERTLSCGCTPLTIFSPIYLCCYDIFIDLSLSHSQA